MIVCVVINGFGCIGCNVVCVLYEFGCWVEIIVVVINELVDVVGMVYLLKYDISYGCFVWEVR